MNRAGGRGFTLVEVLVALIVVAIGLSALMVAVSGTARTSGYLRDKTLAQWISLNRLTEVRLKLAKFGQNTDTGELAFAGRTWHYDTRYFDTSIASMKRVVVRVYAGDAKTKGNPLAESSSFIGNALAPPGSVTVDWTFGSSRAPASPTGGAGVTAPGTNGTPGSTVIGPTVNPNGSQRTPTPNPGQVPVQ